MKYAKITALSLTAMAIGLAGLTVPVLATGGETAQQTEISVLPCQGELADFSGFKKEYDALAKLALANEANIAGKNQKLRMEKLKACLDKAVLKNLVKAETLNQIEALVPLATKRIVLKDLTRVAKTVEEFDALALASINLHQKTRELIDIYYIREGKVDTWKGYTPASEEGVYEAAKAIIEIKLPEAFSDIVFPTMAELDALKNDDQFAKVIEKSFDEMKNAKGKTSLAVFEAIKVAAKKTPKAVNPDLSAEAAQSEVKVEIPNSNVAEPLKLKAETVKTEKSAAVEKNLVKTKEDVLFAYDFKVVDAKNQEVNNFEAGKEVKISLKVEQVQAELFEKGEVALYHFHAGAEAKEIKFDYDKATMTVEFKTDKFSEFVFVKKAGVVTAVTPNQSGNLGAPNTGVLNKEYQSGKSDTILAVVISGLMTAMGAALYKRKR